LSCCLKAANIIRYAHQSERGGIVTNDTGSATDDRLAVLLASLKEAGAEKADAFAAMMLARVGVLQAPQLPALQLAARRALYEEANTPGGLTLALVMALCQLEGITTKELVFALLELRD
jgi:hypothetical protein